MKWVKGLSVVVVAGFVVVGCTPKENEKIIIQERQAPTQLSESLQISSDVSTLILQKSALGKAFLLTPSLVVSKRMPDFNDFKPQIVSFERSASRIGLFRLSSNNLYNTIPTDKLLQTFRIVKETDEALSIDISHGFRNLTLEDHLSIVEAEAVEKNSQSGEGYETTMDIKEALIRKSEVSGNIMYIEQAVRVANLSKVAKEDEEPANNDPSKTELTAKVIIEIKPYILNTNFKSQLFDKEQRVGYFINFAYLAEKEDLLPQITKWDLSEERGAITVALEENIPQEITAAVEEGITYWNRVVGREVLKVRTGFKATGRVSDRMIVVRWVQWDSAGFAYASMQTDPLSGEILRAQVFMTSSWLQSPKNATQLPMAGKTGRAGICVLEQNQMKMAAGLVNLGETHKLKFAQDVIRTVVAHEMGHVMGLRHNFSGSMNHEGSDEDLLQAKKDYLKDEAHPGFPFSSTVMDYERSLETALIGAHIKNATLPYDRAAIGWGYEQEKIELAENSYCSDEHIGLANEQGADVYGCERFDTLKNATLGATQTIKSEIENTVSSAFGDLLRAQSANNPYKPSESLESLAYINFYFDLGQIENLLFVEKDKLSVLSIGTVISQFKTSLSYDSKVTYDSVITNKLSEDLKAVGGVSGLVSHWLDLQNNNADDLHIFENQVQDFFKNLNATQSGLSEADMTKVIEKMTTTAKDADKKVFAEMMSKLVPVYTGNYRYKSGKEYKDAQKNPDKYKAPTMRYRDGVNLGDANLLMTLFKKAILSGKDNVKKITVSGQNLEVQLLGYSNYNREKLIKAFVLENWPASKQSEVRQALTEQLAQLKNEVVANTVAILRAAGQPVPEALTYAELVKAIQAIPSSQMTGIYAYELMYGDLSVLEKIEKTKAE